MYEKKLNILKKLHTIMTAVDFITKDKTNTGHKYEYASEKTIKETFHKQFVDNKVIFLLETTNVKVEKTNSFDKVVVESGARKFKDGMALPPALPADTSLHAEAKKKIDAFVPTPEQREEKTNSKNETESSKQVGFATFVTCKYSFVDIETGESIDGTFIGSGNGRDEKGNYAAVTGAIKYILTSNFIVPTGEDPEKNK
jgi:hypothetical protein